MSRDELLQEVWQGERSSSNVVEVYVRYLVQSSRLEESDVCCTPCGRGYCLGQAAGSLSLHGRFAC